MSIATKLELLQKTKEDIRQALNKLGSDITPELPFSKYVQYILNLKVNLLFIEKNETFVFADEVKATIQVEDQITDYFNFRDKQFYKINDEFIEASLIEQINLFYETLMEISEHAKNDSIFSFNDIISGDITLNNNIKHPNINELFNFSDSVEAFVA